MIPESSRTSKGFAGWERLLEDLKGPPLVVRTSGLESDLGLVFVETGIDGERPLATVGVDTGELLVVGERRLGELHGLELERERVSLRVRRRLEDSFGLGELEELYLRRFELLWDWKYSGYSVSMRFLLTVKAGYAE